MKGLSSCFNQFFQSFAFSWSVVNCIHCTTLYTSFFQGTDKQYSMCFSKQNNQSINGSVIFTWIDALNAGALKLTMTELIETYMPSMIRSANPYFPVELLKQKPEKLLVRRIILETEPMQWIQFSMSHISHDVSRMQFYINKENSNLRKTSVGSHARWCQICMLLVCRLLPSSLATSGIQRQLFCSSIMGIFAHQF